MQTRLLAGLAVLLLFVVVAIVPARGEAGPSFRILEPSTDQSVMDTCTIGVAFQSPDNAPIVRFDAYIDGKFVVGGSVTNPIVAGSFQVPCDLRKAKITPGTHTLVVKLMDSRGRMTERKQEITVTATVERVAPKVRIVSPAPNAGVGPKGTTIEIEASDDSGIKWVMLYINGQFRAMMNEAPYLVPWNPGKDRLASGTYTLRARAFDYFDNETMSDPIVVQVDAGGQTPIELPRTGSQQPLGIFPVSAVPVLSGPAVARQPFANLVAPFTALSGLFGLPDRVAARRDLPTMASCAGLALLPPKALPGAGAQLPTASERILGPVLALANYALPRPRMTGTAGLPVSFVPLYVPAEALTTAVRTEPAQAAAFTAILPPSKSTPVLDAQAVYAVTATQAAPTPAPTVNTAVARVLPAGVIAPSVPVANATQAVPTARTEDASAPVMIALVPGDLLKATPASLTRNVVAVPAETTVTTDVMPRTAPALAHPTPVALTEPLRATAVATSTQATPTTRQDTVEMPRPEMPAALPVKAVPAPTPEFPGATDVTLAPAPPTPAEPVPLTRPALAGLPTPDTTQPVMSVYEPYTVQRGDTIEQIARAYGTTSDELIKLNPGLSPARPLPVDADISVPQSQVRMFLDNTPLAGSTAPFVANGFTMVPMRQVVEAKQGVVIWLPKTREVNAWADNTFMGVKIGDRTARINADTYQLPVAPSLLEQRTMVPLRYLMEALDLRVEYNASSGTYYLVSRATP